MSGKPGYQVAAGWYEQRRDERDIPNAAQHRETPPHAVERRGIDAWARRIAASPSPTMDAALDAQVAAIRRIERELSLPPSRLP